MGPDPLQGKRRQQSWFQPYSSLHVGLQDLALLIQKWGTS